MNVGDINNLTDEVVSELSKWQGSVAEYDEAVRLIKNGELEKAEIILRHLTSKPTIAHGYYRELFKLLRDKIKLKFKNNELETVIEMVTEIIHLNDAMLNEMARYWSGVHKKKRTVGYFSSYSNVKVTEVKLMLKSAIKIGDKKSINLAEKTLKSIEKRITPKIK
ncbi:hypothetical protein [Thorsellia anophelis]|uniref:Uncharacterized protein n=1 Tax=Thorsellia anophelis DSM 18579 TaxID=1123402 RepID=A0A1I0D707_9GAMM|nr:hypothetical protein [Thorsellia anophelis]SET28023.1 hypothetical protein SAMN02583745_01877 [Thorsellia anophelis DSM 18579]